MSFNDAITGVGSGNVGILYLGGRNNYVEQDCTIQTFCDLKFCQGKWTIVENVDFCREVCNSLEHVDFLNLSDIWYF